MNNEIYLLDANGFITPYNTYYQFEFAPTYWETLQNHIENGNIAILDMVFNEITDTSSYVYPLSDWAKAITISKRIDHRTNAVVLNYMQVLEHIKSSPYYKPSALTEWSRDTVADPWLIATAMSDSKYTIVTLETPNGYRSKINPCKKAKIPEIASDMGVKCIHLFDMMKDLKFKL